MVTEIDPSQTGRAAAFDLWMGAPMPMVTLFQTLDVTRLVRLSRRRGVKFNMLMCWCVGKAASRTEQFYLLPVDGKLMRYDSLAVSTVVDLGDGEINTCDVPFSERLEDFQRDYLELTRRVKDSREAWDLSASHMVIGTSALVPYPVDGVVNIYAGVYNNPFIIWGGYRKKLLKTTLPVSFQFHHTQMDGLHAAAFLERLQETINHLKF